MSGKGNKGSLGRATGAVLNRSALFNDPAWEDRFDTLIRVTQRTQLIQELTGCDLRTARLKDAIDRRLAEFGEKAQRPRGLARRATSQSFLATRQERLDGAYLMALHFGGSGQEIASEAEDHLGRALDKRLQVWLTFRASLYPNGAEPKVSFENYCMLISGIRAGAIHVHSCPDCGTRHPWPANKLAQASCPVCELLDLRIKSGREEIEARLREKRAAQGTGYPKFASEA